MKLGVEQLEVRDVPALIAGWDGPETVLYADLTGDSRLERIVAAGVGGSARVVVTDSDGETLANFIAFEDEFRGGGSVTVADGRIVIVPGPGGGARVVTYRLGEGVVSSAPLPASDGYRGGAQVVAAPGGGVLALLDDRLMRLDPVAGAASFAVYVGPDWRFEPTGGWAEMSDGRHAAVLDRGPVDDWRIAESTMVDLVGEAL